MKIFYEIGNGVEMEVATGRGEVKDPHLWGRRKQPLAGYIDKRKNGLIEPARIIGERTVLWLPK